MGGAHLTVGELSSFLMYAFWVGISIRGNIFLKINWGKKIDRQDAGSEGQKTSLLQFPFL